MSPMKVMLNMEITIRDGDTSTCHILVRTTGKAYETYNTTIRNAPEHFTNDIANAVRHAMNTECE